MQKSDIINSLPESPLGIGTAYSTAKLSAAFALSLWLAVPDTVRILCYLMALDTFSGWLVAINSGSLCYNVGWRGLTKKVMTLIVIGGIYFVQNFLAPGTNLVKWVAMAYSLNEFISITLNAEKLNIWVPPMVLSWMKKARNIMGDEQPPNDKDTK